VALKDIITLIRTVDGQHHTVGPNASQTHRDGECHVYDLMLVVNARNEEVGAFHAKGPQIHHFGKTYGEQTDKKVRSTTGNCFPKTSITKRGAVARPASPKPLAGGSKPQPKFS
jgi:hypothetical protein